MPLLKGGPKRWKWTEIILKSDKLIVNAVVFKLCNCIWVFLKSKGEKKNRRHYLLTDPRSLICLPWRLLFQVKHWRLFIKFKWNDICGLQLPRGLDNSWGMMCVIHKLLLTFPFYLCVSVMSCIVWFEFSTSSCVSCHECGEEQVRLQGEGSQVHGHLEHCIQQGEAGPQAVLLRSSELHDTVPPHKDRKVASQGTSEETRILSPGTYPWPIYWLLQKVNKYLIFASSVSCPM